MESIYKGFRKKHDYLICVDTSGCVMDTMNSKHMHCFGPCLVEEWGLQQWEESILHRWNEINLFQLTRGINRFKSLAIVLREIHEKFTPIVGLDTLNTWIEETPALSNDLLTEAISHTDDEDGKICLQKALRWSEMVNDMITNLPAELKQPFTGAKEGLVAASKFADVAVVSSSNRDAVEEEWVYHSLMPYTDIILAQDCGSKSNCIAQMLSFGYGKDHVLMIGDAMGDFRAAEKNGVYFYPILVNWEEESWNALCCEALPMFQAGDYGACQEEKLQVFLENLGG